MNGGFLTTPDGEGYACAGSRIPVEFDAKVYGSGAGVAVGKEDTSLRDALGAGIKAIRDNGKWQAIAEKHVPGVDLWGS